MSPLGMVVLSTLAAVAAVGLTVTGWSQERPSLERAVARLRRLGDVGAVDRTRRPTGGADRVGRVLLRAGGSDLPVLPPPAVLRLAGRSGEVHAAYLALAVVGGLLGPVAALGLLQLRGVVPLGIQLPVAVGLLGAVLAPLVVHSQVVERAREVRIDLRHQLSAYLDVVTMLLAGNSGHEGALEQAAHAGDGRLFGELRRRMREVGASGRSLVDALDQTGRELGLVELQQVAATASLSAAEGAPVARTLAAKCATLRSTLASEQESEARLRTSRLTPPLVGMSLIFMALIIYPALSFSR
jgi:Flp pilus assembly protein TadB